ncbi:hypothetical protein BC835DRAFT_1421587 [Cytidiella melzeri]|nr:hypothetical protein BC835DRAFT_1421587 [Cytidiella melzeri]
MSNSTDQDAVDIISFLQAGLIETSLIFATSALYCYEWMVTLDQEVKYVWAQRWTLSTWIFAVNRYASLVYSILMLAPTPTFIRSVFLHLSQYTILLQFIVAASFSGLRVFALSSRNIWLFLVVFFLNMVPFATNMFHYITDPVEFTDDAECLAPLGTSAKVELGYILDATVAFTTRGSIILADVIVLVVTWVKTVGTVREASRINIKVPLSEILLRDGTLFFICLLGINVFILLVNDLPLSEAVGLSIFGGSFVALTPPIIISRFLLNLRQASNQEPESGTVAQKSTTRFKSDMIVGNMGQSLRFGRDEDEDSVTGSEDEHSGIELGELDASPVEGFGHDIKDKGEIQEVLVV